MGQKKNKTWLIGSISITSAVLLIVTVIGPQLIFDTDEPNRLQRQKKLWDIIVPDDYETIQEAVENAQKGYRIFVRSGIYKSPNRFVTFPLIIDKPELTICGENKNSTIISGRSFSTPVHIKADSVNFSGFTIQDNGLNCSLLQVYSKNCIISNNSFISNDFFDGVEYGVVFYRADENLFFDNYLTGADNGLEIRGSNHNNIFNNTFEKNDYALYLGGSYTIDISRGFLDRVQFKPSVGNILKNNTFSANYEGISVYSCSNNQFLNNHFDSQRSAGLRLSSCSNNIINNNEFSNDGLEIWGKELSHYIHEVKDNMVNGKPLYYFYNQNNFKVPVNAGQIIIVDCNNVQIEREKISKTTTAILIVFSTKIIIRYNDISSNIRGVYLFYSTQCTVSKNNFIKNSLDAFFISDGFFNSRTNSWVANYWDDWLGTKSILFSFTNKRIVGRFYLNRFFRILDPLSIGIRTKNIDRFPANKPYNY